VPSEEKTDKLLQLGIELPKAGGVDEALKLFGEALEAAERAIQRMPR
jgi:hypothetical protein